MKKIIKIIDAHTHVFPDKIAEKCRISVGTFYDLPMYTSGTISELEKIRNIHFMQDGIEYRIARQLICSPAVTASQTYNINRFISEQVAANRNLLGFGTLHPENENFEEVIDSIIDMNLCGIKFHSDFQHFNIDDKCMYPIYEYAAKKKLPVLFHMGDKKLDYSSPCRLKRVLEDIPELRVIAAHMGGYSRWNEAFSLHASDNLYFDISSSLGIIPKKMFFDFLERFGYSHFFFGSDFPMWNPYEMLKILLKYQLDETMLCGITHDNFMKFINIEEE